MAREHSIADTRERGRLHRQGAARLAASGRRGQGVQRRRRRPARPVRRRPTRTTTRSSPSTPRAPPASTRRPAAKCAAWCATSGSWRGRGSTASSCSERRDGALSEEPALERPDHLIEFLSGVEIFSAFTPQEMAEIAAGAESRTYAFGDTVCSAGDPSEGLYVIKSGAMRLFTKEGGKEVSVGCARPVMCSARSPCCANTATRRRCAPRARPSCCYSRAAVRPADRGQPGGARASSTSTWRIGSAGGFSRAVFDLRARCKSAGGSMS